MKMDAGMGAASTQIATAVADRDLGYFRLSWTGKLCASALKKEGQCNAYAFVTHSDAFRPFLCIVAFVHKQV